MIDNIEYHLESMSFRDMASRFLNSADLEALMTALEDQSSKAYENSSESLLEGFEELRNKDAKIAFVFVEQISNIIKAKAFRPEDIPKLIRSISYSAEMQSDIQHKYKNKGVMSWTEFGIIVHSGATAKKPDGSPAYNLGHIFDHEISHSIVESEAVTLSQIQQIFEGTNIAYESSVVQALVDQNADQELILKERFCEVSSCYLQSFGEPDRLISFLDKMTKNSSVKDLKDSDTEQATAMFNNYRLIFERLERLWPSVSSHISELSLDDIYELAQGDDLEFDIEEPEIVEEQATPIQMPGRISGGGDSGSDETLKNMKLPKMFEESSELGKNNKPESFSRTTQYLLKDFADSLDIFSSGMAA